MAGNSVPFLDRNTTALVLPISRGVAAAKGRILVDLNVSRGAHRDTLNHQGAMAVCV